jgi:hypothetical protein
MNKDPTQFLFKRLLKKLDLNFISYIGYPPDETVPYPDGFMEGYHKCIEDLIHEAKGLGLDPAVQCHPAE